MLEQSTTPTYNAKLPSSLRLASVKESKTLGPRVQITTFLRTLCASLTYSCSDSRVVPTSSCLLLILAETGTRLVGIRLRVSFHFASYRNVPF